MNHPQTLTTPNVAANISTSAATSSDRLSFTLFLAVAIHGLLIFGLTFKTSDPSESSPSVTVTLATHASQAAPDEADFLAQSNQLGSGSILESKEITTDVISPFDSTTINETVITKQQQAQRITSDEQRVISSHQGTNKINSTPQPNKADGKTAQAEQLDIDSVNSQIASLKAKLAKQRQAYAKIPRERVLTSVSTLAASEAAYLNQWTERIETIGNQQFPKEALRKKLTGKARLQVVIKHDGTIVEVSLKQSSGYKIFDDSAQQIVHRASPFMPFPPEIRKDYEHLVIIRTWHFDISGITTVQ